MQCLCLGRPLLARRRVVQRGTVRDGQQTSVIEMSRSAPDEQDTLITESLIRRFWVGYQKLMGFETPAMVAE